MGFSWKSSSAGLLPFVREENFLAQWCDVAHLVYTYIVDLAAHFSTANHKGRGGQNPSPCLLPFTQFLEKSSLNLVSSVPQRGTSSSTRYLPGPPTAFP